MIIHVPTSVRYSVNYITQGSHRPSQEQLIILVYRNRGLYALVPLCLKTTLKDIVNCLLAREATFNLCSKKYKWREIKLNQSLLLVKELKNVNNILVKFTR